MSTDEENKRKFNNFIKELNEQNWWVTPDCVSSDWESDIESSSDDEVPGFVFSDSDSDTDAADADADADEMINGSEQCSEEVDHRNSEIQLNVDYSKKRIIMQEDLQCGKRQRQALVKQGTKEKLVQDPVSLLEGKDYCPQPEEELRMDEDLRLLQESHRTDESKDQQQPDIVLYKPVLEKQRTGLVRVDTCGSIRASRGKAGHPVLKKGGYGVTICGHDGKLIVAAAGVSNPISIAFHKLEAVKKGMELAIQYGFSQATVHIESQLVIHGLNTGSIGYKRASKSSSNLKYVYLSVAGEYSEGGKYSKYSKEPTEENTRRLLELLKQINEMTAVQKFPLVITSRRSITAAEHLSMRFTNTEMDLENKKDFSLWRKLEKLIAEAERLV